MDIEINGNPVDIRMKLGDTGEAFFVEQIADGDEVSSILGTSPLPTSFFDHYEHRSGGKEDDLRSQDSGVEAEDLTIAAVNSSNTRDNNKHTSNVPTPSQSIDVTSNRIDDGHSNFNRKDFNVTKDFIGISKVKSVKERKLATARHEELVRSKSLTTESELFQALLDGQGSKTDGEDVNSLCK